MREHARIGARSPGNDARFDHGQAAKQVVLPEDVEKEFLCRGADHDRGKFRAGRRLQRDTELLALEQACTAACRDSIPAYRDVHMEMHCSRKAAGQPIRYRNRSSSTARLRRLTGTREPFRNTTSS